VSLLAVDPGEHCGWSLWQGGRLTRSGIVDGSTASEPASLIEGIRPRVVVSEDWHIPRRIKSGHTGLKVYAYRADLWVALSEAFACRHVHVSPQSWRTWANREVDGEPIPSGQKTAAHHRAIIDKATIVADEYGLRLPIVRDQCDAILIGAWAVATGVGA
jgi:hypothetical protein